MRNLFTMSLLILSVVAYSDGFGGGMRSGGWNGGGVSGGRGAKYGSAPARTYYGAGAGAPVGSNSKNTTGKALPSRRGLGISAWGIIAIIISAIMLVAGTYYFFIFYPLICKKERNYDVMELHQSPV